MGVFHIVMYYSKCDRMKFQYLEDLHNLVNLYFLHGRCSVHSKFKVPQWILMQLSTKGLWLLFQFVGNCKPQRQSIGEEVEAERQNLHTLLPSVEDSS